MGSRQRSGGRPELEAMTVPQLKQLRKELLASPYGLKLQVVMPRMQTSLKEDYIQNIIEMETRIQQWTDSNEPLEDKETDKLKRRMERSMKTRKERINNSRREMYSRMFDRFNAFLLGVRS